MQLGAARLAVVLPTIPEDPNQTGPDTSRQLQDAELPNTGREPDINLQTHLGEDRFYDPEAEDVGLELSGTHLLGSKEALEDPPKDEGRSKRVRTTLTVPIDPNE